MERQRQKDRSGEIDRDGGSERYLFIILFNRIFDILFGSIFRVIFWIGLGGFLLEQREVIFEDSVFFYLELLEVNLWYVFD